MQDAAIGIVKDSNNQILWVKRQDVPVWVLPGGGIDQTETPENAAIREVFEETGVTVSIKRKTAEYSPINRWTATTHVFLCQRENGSLLTSLESSEVAFFPLDSPPYPRFPLHDIWIKDALCHFDHVIQRPLKEFSWWKVGCFFLKHPFIFLKYLLKTCLKSKVLSACGRDREGDHGRDREDGHDHAP